MYLIVEGWRSSHHSYALVNQYQLLQLMDDSRFELAHRDVPFYRSHWGQLDAGLPAEARARLAALPPPAGRRADAVYRISWPLRLQGADAEHVVVFGTCELNRFPPNSFTGRAGDASDAEKRSVHIVTPSQWSRTGFLRNGFDEQRVHVIPHGVDPMHFSPVSAPEKRHLRRLLGLREDALVFLNIGAMTWNKGIGPLLAAFARFRVREPRAMLLLKGGDTLYGNQLKGSAEEAAQGCPEVRQPQVAESIRYVAQNLSRADLARLYQVSDAYVAPYRAEGFNIPVLEALACGIPAIVTAGGSTDDFCPDHLCLRIAATPVSNGLGRYLEPNAESLLSCLEQLAQRRDLVAAAGAEGPVWAAERYSWEVVTRQLAELLLRTAGGVD